MGVLLMNYIISNHGTQGKTNSSDAQQGMSQTWKSGRNSNTYIYIC